MFVKIVYMSFVNCPYVPEASVYLAVYELRARYEAEYHNMKISYSLLNVADNKGLVISDQYKIKKFT